MPDWLILTASLPTTPSGLRVRIWRALKSIGCATLREGVYLLPASAATAGELWAVERAIHEGGAEAHMLQLDARNASQEAAFRALFDRTEAYKDFSQALKDTRKRLRTASGPELRKLLRSLEQQRDALRHTDHFPGLACADADEGLVKLRVDIDLRLSPGEPKAESRTIERLSTTDFQRRIWATRRRPWVDRLASAWLVQRFIDAQPRFVWIDGPGQCPADALGYDFDGARFSHVGDRVTFEVLLHAFGLEHDIALATIGRLVHCIDIGGVAVDEAAGIEALVRGLQVQHDDDDALLAAACTMFDALHAALLRPAE